MNDEKMKKCFHDRISKAQKIIISTHIHPDADGIGSQVSLCMALNLIGKNAICVNEEKLLDRYEYLDSQSTIISYEEFLNHYHWDEIDLFIIVDTNSIPRIGPKMQELVSRSKKFLIIDHHPCPKELMIIHCIDTTKAATGELVGNLIESMNIPFTKELALPLYTSIIIDTSSFRYPTVTGATHKLVGKLLDTGIKPPKAYNMIYGTKKLSHMQLLGRTLSNAKTTDDGRVAWLTLTESLMNEYKVDPEDTHAFVNHLLILDNVEIACMFREHGKTIKVSFRSAGEVDIGVMAQALGGGGHNHSSATILDGPLDEAIEETIHSLVLMLKEKESEVEKT